MIPSPLLVVTDRHGSGRPLQETVRAALEGGARWIWFRDRDLEKDERRDLAIELLSLVREAGGRLTVGGDMDLAAEIEADGVHLSASAVTVGDAVRASSQTVITSEAKQSREPHRPTTKSGLLRFARNDVEGTNKGLASVVAAARHRCTAGALIGLSAHDLAEVRAAAEAGADYVTLSPIFASASKPGYGPALGLDTIRAAANIGIPVLALGGIELANARDCPAAGASGVAVMGGIMRATDPGERARQLLDALELSAQVNCTLAHGAAPQDV